jgi:hypothetical protein
MTQIKRWTPADAGCLISSGHGWRSVGYVIQMAMDNGYSDKASDRLAVTAFLDNRTTFTDSFGIEQDTSDWVLDQGGLADTAVDWLNEHIAPEGHLFHWHEGDFYLSPLSTLEEES